MSVLSVCPLSGLWLYLFSLTQCKSKRTSGAPFCWGQRCHIDSLLRNATCWTPCMENRWGHCCWTLPIDLICACLLTLANHWSRRPSSPCAVHGKITLLDRIPVSELQDFSGSLRRRLWWLHVRLIPRIFWFQSGYLISLSSHPRNKTRDRDEHLPLPTLEKKEEERTKDIQRPCVYLHNLFTSKGHRKYYTERDLLCSIFRSTSGQFGF